MSGRSRWGSWLLLAALGAGVLVGYRVKVRPPRRVASPPPRRVAPEELEPSFLEGAAHIEAGRFEQAVTSLEAAVAAKPELGPAWLALGTARGGAGDLQGARQALERARELDPRDWRPLAALAAHALILDQPAVAEDLYRKALALSPTALPALDGLARALEAQGVEAIGDTRQARPDLLARALEAQLLVVAQTPSDAEARLRAASLAHQLQDTAQQRAQLEAAVKAAPRNGEVRLAMGRFLVSQGEAEAALTELRQAIASGAPVAETEHQIGLALEVLGDWQGAADAHARATSTATVLPAAHFRRAAALRRLGREDAAAGEDAAFRIATEWLARHDSAENDIRRAPGDPARHVTLGLAQLRIGRASAAEQSFLRALGLGAGNDARVGLAEARLRQEQWDGAMEEALRVNADEPDNAGAWRVLSAVRLHEGNRQDAATGARRAEEIESRQPWMQDVATSIAGKRWSEVAARLDAVVQREPRNLNAWNDLCGAHMMGSPTIVAEQCFLRLQEIDPSNDQVRKAIEHLRGQAAR